MACSQPHWPVIQKLMDMQHFISAAVFTVTCSQAEQGCSILPAYLRKLAEAVTCTMPNTVNQIHSSEAFVKPHREK